MSNQSVVVQTQAANGSNVTTASASWPAPTTAGNTLIAVVETNNGFTITPSDATWQLRLSSAHCRVYEIQNAASRSGAETFTCTTAQAIGITLIEVSGITGYDTSTSGSGTSSQLAAGPLTTGPSSGFIVVAGYGSTFPQGDVTDTTTWTDPFPSLQLANGHGRTVYARPANGTQTLSATFSGTDNSWDSVIVSYNVTGQTGASLSANAGANQQVPAGATVTLRGSATGGTAPYTYAWTQTGGPAVTLSNASAASPTFTAPADVNGDTLTFSLQVTDSATPTHATATATTTVTVAPGPYLYRRVAGAWTRMKLYRRVSGVWQWP